MGVDGAMGALPPTPLSPTSRYRRRWLGLGAGMATASVVGFVVYRLWPGDAATMDASDDVCIVAPAIAFDPSSELRPEQPRPIPADARCPVCGMYPSRSPQWAAQVLYRDGHVHFVDSPIDLFQLMRDVPRHRAGHTTADILSTWVTDAPSGQWIATEKAWYVHGSDALGPMRMGDLPAFASRSAALAFARQRGGQLIEHGAITQTLIKSLAIERNHALHQHP